MKFLKKLKNKLLKDKRVALIKLEGIIIDSAGISTTLKVLKAIEDVKNNDFKALVLKINSPGGTVGASQELHSALMRLKKDGIKVVVSLGDVAASGGVYVAVAGDKIVSNSGTVTGSIGVIIKNNVLKDLYKKIGVDHQVVKSGPYKDILSDTKYLSDEEIQILQELIDSTYEQFVKTVADGRNLEIEDVKKIADGRIFSGLQAQSYGLVDEIGTLADAIDLAGKLIDVEKPKVVEMTPKKNFISRITGANINMIEHIVTGSSYSGIPMWIMPKF